MAQACCCCASPAPVTSSRFRRPLRRLPATRLTLPFAPPPPSSRLRSPVPVSPDPPPPDAHADDADADAVDCDDRYGLEIHVSARAGKRNRRVVSARVRVDAPLEAVWATLTDYEGLADFIPGLTECRLLQQDHRFARLYQVGEQDLALGFKFNAKGTIDCYEGEIELLPAPRARRREIAFNMVDGDFNIFQGKWSVQQQEQQQEFRTTLSYQVELEPKLWIPVKLLEGRICSEIKKNLVSIREQAQRIQGLYCSARQDN